MSMMPAPARSFVVFAQLLRANGFAVAPEQTTSLMEAVALLGPRDVAEIRRAAHATLAPPPERRADFDALFGAHFLGETSLLEVPDRTPEDDVKVQDERRGGRAQPLQSDEINEAGQEAARSEALSVRLFTPGSDDAAMNAFRREMPKQAPRRRGYRMRADRRGRSFDLKRSLRESVRADGDVFRLHRLARRSRPRNFLLLIDVSGSMKARTEANLRLAHTLAQALERVEVFTFGTRLTRLTRALKLKNRDAALAEAAGVVSDWDGGTRIGDALQAFLAVPRFAGYARGAVVVVLSDGLERGEPHAMRGAVARLARRAWRISWLSPLAIGAGFAPRTEALVAIAPFIDDLADGSSLETIARHLLALGERRSA